MYWKYALCFIIGFISGGIVALELMFAQLKKKVRERKIKQASYDEAFK